MAISLLVNAILSMIDFLLNSFSVDFDYLNFLQGLEVWSYGVHVLGADLFYMIMTSVLSFYLYKLGFAIFNWIWQQLPLT